MSKKIIITPNAPAPIGPYSQAVQAGNMLYVSGQIAIIPETGEIVGTGVADETRQVMKNLEAILTKAGTSFSKVVKCSIFVKSMGDFAIVNEIYGTCFTSEPPARETVEVSALPKYVNVEISCIAMV